MRLDERKQRQSARTMKQRKIAEKDITSKQCCIRIMPTMKNEEHGDIATKSSLDERGSLGCLVRISEAKTLIGLGFLTYLPERAATPRTIIMAHSAFFEYSYMLD
jgi:hypothetical protein